MNELTFAPDDPQAVMGRRFLALMDVSRVWLGIADGSRARLLKTLEHGEMLQALQNGERVVWRDWTIKCTPPKRIGPGAEDGLHAPGILAISAHGFVFGLHITPECVRATCRQIREMEDHLAIRAAAELKERTHLAWEMDDD